MISSATCCDLFSDVPEITKYPEDITADEGETVEFHCSVDDGDPHVRWGWKKQDGTLDNQRYCRFSYNLG